MVESTRDELRRIFDLAALRLQAKRLRTGQDWQDARAVTERFEKARAREEDAYRREYPVRVEMERRRLIDEAGSKRREFNHPFAGRDRFDKDAIQRQAERNVRGAHHARMASLDTEEARGIEAVMNRAEGKTRLKDMAQQEFARATDRRKPRPRER